MKRQSSDWEKIIANEATDKGLISKIYEYFILDNEFHVPDFYPKEQELIVDMCSHIDFK